MSDVEAFVIVPTYNEADNLDDLVSQLLALPVRVSVLVVDDNSPDGTGQMADAWAAKHPAAFMWFIARVKWVWARRILLVLERPLAN